MKNLKQALQELKEEKPGLWANIRAKRDRGEKPAHKNSNAHKDAVKAGKEINAMSEEQGKFYVGYNLGRGQGKGIFKTPYDSYEEAKKEVEKSYRLDKGSRNMTAYYVADENGNLIQPVKEKTGDDFTDFLSSRGTDSRPDNWKVVEKDSEYSLESDDRSGRVRVMYGENPIAFGYNDWSTGGYQIEHSSWKNEEKHFQFAKDIIDHFKSNKITTEAHMVKPDGSIKTSKDKPNDKPGHLVRPDGKINKVSEANVNPEAEKLVGNFIMKLAKRYGYGAKDAIYLIQSVISNIEASGKLNEGEEWPEEVPSRHGDIIFKLIKVMPDRAKYALLDAETGKEWEPGGRVFGSIKSLMASAEDTIMPQGGRQSTNLGEDKSDAVRWFGNVKYFYTKAFVELKGEDKQLYIQMLKDYFSKL